MLYFDHMVGGAVTVSVITCLMVTSFTGSVHVYASVRYALGSQTNMNKQRSINSIFHGITKIFYTNEDFLAF